MAKKAKQPKKAEVSSARSLIPKRLPAWKEFEGAVASFIRTLDPSAVVQEDVKLPDIDTGRPRQRDVVVRATVCQLFPLTILISCKLKKRALSEEDIDHFVGEIRSAGAQLGVLYASSFGTPAIEKANKLSISCCKLFLNTPAELPQQIVIRQYYCRPTIRLSVSQPIDPVWEIVTWGDLFSTEAIHDGKLVPTIDAISQIAMVRQKSSSSPSPSSWEQEISLVYRDVPSVSPLSLTVIGDWRFFESRVEAHLLNGSYSLTTGKFVGQQHGPSVDLWSSNPGDGWTELPSRPNDVSSHVTLMVFAPLEGIKLGLKESLSHQPIIGGKSQ